MALAYNLLVTFIVVAFISSLVIAYIKGRIKTQLTQVSILLFIYAITVLVEYLVAKNLTPETGGMLFVLIIGVRVISKLYIFIAALISLLLSIFKKKVPRNA